MRSATSAPGTIVVTGPMTPFFVGHGPRRLAHNQLYQTTPESGYPNNPLGVLTRPRGRMGGGEAALQRRWQETQADCQIRACPNWGLLGGTDEGNLVPTIIPRGMEVARRQASKNDAPNVASESFAPYPPNPNYWDFTEHLATKGAFQQRKSIGRFLAKFVLDFANPINLASFHFQRCPT